MATLANGFDGTLPATNSNIVSAEVRTNFAAIETFLESTNIDEANVDLTGTDGIVGKSTAQDISGLKSFESTAAGAGGVRTVARFGLDPASGVGTANDGIRLLFYADDAGNAESDIAFIDAVMTTATAGSEVGRLDFYVAAGAGSAVSQVQIRDGSFVPTTNDDISLGITTLGFSDLHLGTGGVINWANGEVTVTETDANTLTLAGATTLDLGAVATLDFDGVLAITTVGALTLTPTTDVLVSNGTGLVVGHTAQVTGWGGATPELQVIGTAGVDSAIAMGRWSADSGSPQLYFQKSRNAAIGSFTIVNDGDQLGILDFYGDDGVDFSSSAAYILVAVDGTPGSNDMPGRIVFATTPDGSASSTEALRITSGRVLTTLAAAPANVTAAGAGIWGGGVAFSDVANAHIDDATHGTGTVTHYIGNQTIDTTASDVRLKSNITAPNGLALRHLTVLADSLREYDYKNEPGRFVGIPAQDILEALPEYVVGNKEQWSVRYHYMVGPLLWGWQDHERRLAKLERKAA